MGHEEGRTPPILDVRPADWWGVDNIFANN